MPDKEVPIRQKPPKIELLALMFAGVGTLAAAIALLLQYQQMAENAAINKRVVEGLALQRVEALRNSGVNIADDWAGQEIKVAQLNWQGLSFLNTELGDCQSRVEVSGTGHQDATIEGTTVRCMEFPNFSNFSGLKLHIAKFERISGVGAVFDQSQMSTSSIRNSDLVGSSFQGARLTHHTFQKTDLRGASFSNAKLSGWPESDQWLFREVNLIGADFRGAHISVVGDISQFRGACFDGTTTLLEMKEKPKKISDGYYQVKERRIYPTDLNRCMCKKIDRWSGQWTLRQAFLDSLEEAHDECVQDQ